MKDAFSFPASLRNTMWLPGVEALLASQHQAAIFDTHGQQTEHKATCGSVV
jgi:hypothetical protein